MKIWRMFTIVKFNITIFMLNPPVPLASQEEITHSFKVSLPRAAVLLNYLMWDDGMPYGGREDASLKTDVCCSETQGL